MDIAAPSAFGTPALFIQFPNRNAGVGRGQTHRAVWRASPRHARTALAKGELDLTNILFINLTGFRETLIE